MNVNINNILNIIYIFLYSYVELWNINVYNFDMFKDIKFVFNNKKWKSYEKINLGFSNELKYLAIDINNQKHLIRIADKSMIAQKLFVKRFLEKIKNLNFNKPYDYECDLFNNDLNSYSISKWVDGDPLKFIFENEIDINNKYNIGYECGSYLKKIHSIDVNDKDKLDIKAILNKRNKKICEYLNIKMRNKKVDTLASFYHDNSKELEFFIPKYIHNEYHLSNIVFDKKEKIGIINFDKALVEDPYLDLVKMQIFNSEEHPEFCIGMLHGYFNNKIPQEFWLKYATLTAYKCITISLWASKNNLSKIIKTNRIINNIINQYNNFKFNIPNWYYENVIKPNKSQFEIFKEFTICLTEKNIDDDEHI